jgi:glycosyltransferase involved in cell wall biosynthesis
MLVPPKDPAALSEAIVKLLGDKKLRLEMGKNGRRRALENYSWPVAAKNTLEVYKQVIEDYGKGI